MKGKILIRKLTGSRNWTVPFVQVDYFNSSEQRPAAGRSKHSVNLFPWFTWEHQEGRPATNTVCSRLLRGGQVRSYLAVWWLHVIPSHRLLTAVQGWDVNTRQFRQTVRASSPHQLLSELLWVKSEKRGPPAAPAWAWRSGEGWKKTLQTRNKWARTDLTRCRTCSKGFRRWSQGHLIGG